MKNSKKMKKVGIEKQKHVDETRKEKWWNDKRKPLEEKDSATVIKKWKHK